MIVEDYHVVAIDPGTTHSAWVVLKGGSSVSAHGIEPNEDVVARCMRGFPDVHPSSPVVIEMVQSLGMAVGRETFETVFWIGRFYEGRQPLPTHRMYRQRVKMHLCGSMKAKDANIRQALIDRYGPPGVKASPGKLYGIRSHEFAALAVAVTFWDNVVVKNNTECLV